MQWKAIKNYWCRDLANGLWRYFFFWIAFSFTNFSNLKFAKNALFLSCFFNKYPKDEFSWVSFLRNQPRLFIAAATFAGFLIAPENAVVRLCIASWQPWRCWASLRGWLLLTVIAPGWRGSQLLNIPASPALRRWAFLWRHVNDIHLHKGTKDIFKFSSDWVTLVPKTL